MQEVAANTKLEFCHRKVHGGVCVYSHDIDITFETALVEKKNKFDVKCFYDMKFCPIICRLHFIDRFKVC